MMRVLVAPIAVIVLASPCVRADDSEAAYVLPLSIAAGMGANYQTTPDVVEMINGTYAPLTRVPQFSSAADFFGAVSIPASARWVVKFEYAYSLSTTNISTSGFGPFEFTTAMHMPTCILQYVLMGTQQYHLKAGVGGGFFFGTMNIRYGGIDEEYKANGPGMVAALEGQTALSEQVFMYLGAEARWSFVGELKNSAGRPPGVNAEGQPATLHRFSVGARLGFSYAF
jgi:hypothetical protein